MLADDFRRAGNWLFRWRSYLPLVLFLLFIPAARDYALRGGGYPGRGAWEGLCLAIACLGLAVRIATVGFVPAGTSGRNTLTQQAASLNATGMYSVVRHPIYLGNFLMWFGLSLLPRCWWFTLITVLAFWLYYERIMFAEEGFLFDQFGAQYQEWTLRTPAFIPRWAGWVSPDLPFSVKSAVAREYSTFFTIIALFTAMNGVISWFARGTPVPDGFTVTLFFAGLMVYGTVRLIKKRTDLLRTAGR